MRAALHLAWRALRADSTPREIAARIASAIVIASALTLCGFAFLLVEPLP